MFFPRYVGVRAWQLGQINRMLSNWLLVLSPCWLIRQRQQPARDRSTSCVCHAFLCLLYPIKQDYSKRTGGLSTTSSVSIPSNAALAGVSGPKPQTRLTGGRGSLCIGCLYPFNSPSICRRQYARLRLGRRDSAQKIHEYFPAPRLSRPEHLADILMHPTDYLRWPDGLRAPRRTASARHIRDVSCTSVLVARRHSAVPPECVLIPIEGVFAELGEEAEHGEARKVGP